MADTEPVEILRPADLFLAQVDLHNLKATKRSLVRIEPGEPAAIILVLPPQHYRERPTTTVQASKPTAIAAANASKLEFVVPDGVNELEIPETGLLGLCESLGAATTYAIWVPARTWLRPREAKWVLGLTPVEHQGRTDLWRAKVVGPHRGGSLAARFTLENVIGGQDGPDWPEVKPTATHVFTRYRNGVMVTHRFDLSPFGASARLRGPIGYGPELTATPEVEPYLNTYEHDVDFGRDTRVKVVRRGHLSSGHRASCEQLVRRVFSTDGDKSVAWLEVQSTVIVQEPDLHLDQLAAAYPHNEPGGERARTQRLTRLEPEPQVGEPRQPCQQIRQPHRTTPRLTLTPSPGTGRPTS